MKRVLVVDVNKDQKRPMFIMLDNAGVNTKPVSSYEELIKYLKVETPDLVIVDWDMRNSYLKPTDFMPALRAITPSPKLAFITSKPRRESVMKMDSMDPDLILIAPLSPKIIQDKLIPLAQSKSQTNYEKRLMYRGKMKAAVNNNEILKLPACYAKIDKEIRDLKSDRFEENQRFIELKIAENNLGYHGWLASIISTNSRGLLGTRDMCLVKALEINPLNIKLYRYLLKSERIRQKDADKWLLMVLDNIPVFEHNYQILVKYVIQAYKLRFPVSDTLRKRASYICSKRMHFGFN